MSLRIKSIESDSLGEYLQLAAGDRLLKINGRRVIDELDYQFRIQESTVLLDLDIRGQHQQIEVEKDEEDDLGVTFESMTIRKCANDCIFCFVDQNPDNMRDGLYFRDGDYRLSFLYGHYITLTNMGQRELERIVEQRMTPLYISVHATDPELRKRLLLYKKDDNLLEKLQFLVGGGIELHTQVVLCPTLNDGKQLERTLRDLATFRPGLKSVAVIPVGLTGHREGLTEIPPVTPNYAESFLEIYTDLDSRFRQIDGSRWVVPSDEWFVHIGQEVPEADYYGDLAIEENGVGQVRTFLDRFQEELKRLPTQLNRPVTMTLATGESAGPVFEKHVLPMLNGIDGLTVFLETVPNTLFGAPVTVAGLLSGSCFIKQLKGKDLGEAVWTTRRILNDDGSKTLDDMTLCQISDALGTPCKVVDDSVLEIFREGTYG